MRELKPLVEKAAVGYIAVNNAIQMAGNIKRRVRSHFAYSISIESTDYIYNEIQEWLLSQINPRTLKSLKVRTWPNKDDEYEVQRFVDTRRQQTVFLDGQKIVVRQEEAPKEAMSVTSYGSIKAKPDSVLFTAYSRSGQKAVERLFEKILADKKHEDGVGLYTLRYSNWTKGSVLPPRELDSVILPGGQLERIAADLKEFLESEETYNKLSIPYHRGYLFYGPPGTGKTSLVKALAYHFKRDLYFISLNETKKDSALLNLIGDIEGDAILLLEDIDVFNVTQERDGDGDDITLSALLQALDGVATPHGLITIMTTNDRDSLDPALVRTGRVDLKEEIGLASRGEVARLFEYFYGERLDNCTLDDVPLAEVAEVFKRNLSDPLAAEKELLERANS